ncbi:hypothetical protein SDC9_55207 [bioreactor metagenome]|uniref:SPOR domain-containing protein n=1 Tax=bioreactor metagenome TaxID=1076179 RepID=A0A644WZ63_9ZZZZ
MSDSWNSTTEKSDISVVSNLPDFAVSNQQDVADNNNQNVSDNNHQNDAGNNNADNNQNNTDNFNAQTTDKVVASDEEQDLIQSSFYEAGAQTFMVRIASLKKKLATHPADSNQIRSEIDALTRTMQAYNAEADAYRSNAENNLKLMNRQVPDHIPAYSEMSVIEFHQQQYELEMHKADSVRKLADASTDPAAKSRLQKQADDFEESAKRHYLMATDLYGVWNNSEYENNNVALTESNAARSQDSDNARMKMIEARQLRSEAYRERDFAKQREMLKLAQDKEKQALDLQQKVLAANNIDNPEKIVSRTVSEIETSTGNDIAEITKRYPLDKDMLSNYEKSAVSNQDVTDNHQNDNNNNHDNNNNVVADNNHDVTDNHNVADNHNVTDNHVDRDTVSSGQLPQDSSQLSVVSGQWSVASDTAKADNRLYYRIQISASRVEVDTTKYFKGMNVVVDKTGGWNQYMTGYFTSYNIANADLKRVRQQGYADAFVVAYYDGKRVPVYEARQREQGGTPALAAQTGGTGNFSMNDVEGLVYSVQVGVYATTRNSTSLFGISPLIEERMTNGYYRYYAGTFNNMNDAVAARNKVRSGGVPDAFVVILYKGKKITQAEADRLQAEGTGFGGGLKQSGTGTQKQNTQVTPANTTPSSKPVFKVQIGAYSKDVPVTVVNTLIEIAGQGIETTKNDAGLTVYTVGSFSKYSEAEAKKTELNAKGLADAFVVAYVDGKRVSVSEARKIVE